MRRLVRPGPARPSGRVSTRRPGRGFTRSPGRVLPGRRSGRR